jgi:hypothetical protein
VTPGRASFLRRAGVPVGTALAVAAIVAASALARAPVQLEDPNDVRGPLDVRVVSLEEVDGPTWSVEIQLPWSPPKTWDRAFLFVYLDTIGDQRADAYALVRSTGTELSGSLWRDPRRGNDIKLRPLGIDRVSPRVTSLRIPLASVEIGRFRSVYRWWVVSTFSGDACRRTCIDRVPDAGAVEQLLPGASPTPTTTPSPTGSPTLTPSPTP